MQATLEDLRIDRAPAPAPRARIRVPRWIVGLSGMLLSAAALLFAYSRISAAPRVRTVRAQPEAAVSSTMDRVTILKSSGYIVAAHKIEVASKVPGRLAWIGVEKGQTVKQGQVLVKLEDDEYRARALQAEGNLKSLRAKLRELQSGLRPQEIARAQAEFDSAVAELENYRTTLARIRALADSGILAAQALDDARAKDAAQAARVTALRQAYELAELGPRQEQIDSVRAQIEEAQGNFDYARTQLNATSIRAPVGGTILERNVEKGEFVTTGFVGDRGAKGYVVSLANLNDLQVELDIDQNNFAKLKPDQRAIIMTDAYPDKKYEGRIVEISPQADRQKATVQVKVQIEHPNNYLRPDMNASVEFYDQSTKAAGERIAQSRVIIPQSALRENAVFVVSKSRAVRRLVTVAGPVSGGLAVEHGLAAGEEIIIDPPQNLKDGARVHVEH